MPTEIELKFAVDDEKAFDSLLRHLDLPAREFHRTVTQVNHFFDTPGFRLFDQGITLRLREEGSRHILTLKAKEEVTTDDGVLTERIEEEVRLAPNIAVDVLRGSLSPRDALAQRISERNPDAVRLLDTALERAELHYVGQFENQRTRVESVPVQIGEATVPLVFELDTTRFGPDKVDHEMEIELGSSSDAQLAHASISAQLEAAGIAWRSAPSKAKRFFELAREQA